MTIYSVFPGSERYFVNPGLWRVTCRRISGESEKQVFNILRKFIFWNYARNTWQWDVLCVVILIFIFLTPKSWFENGERGGRWPHQNSVASILLIRPEVADSVEDKARLEQRLRELTGRTALQVLDVRKLTDAEGKITGYEVDIR